MNSDRVDGCSPFVVLKTAIYLSLVLQLCGIVVDKLFDSIENGSDGMLEY